ncbi:MAG: DUF433 domain-containing protein [Terriglobales bacterium]
MTDNSYTPAEASAIAKLPLKAVQKVLDSRLIRPRRSRQGNRILRLLSAQHLIYLRLEAEGVRLLPVAARREVARAIEASPNAAMLSISGGPALVVRVERARKEVGRELKRLRKAQVMAVSSSEVMRGTPVYRGTRIPIDLVATMLAQGASVEEVLEGYPALNRELIELAPLYVAAFPRRGRPARRPWAKQKPARVARYQRAAKA